MTEVTPACTDTSDCTYGYECKKAWLATEGTCEYSYSKNCDLKNQCKRNYKCDKKNDICVKSSSQQLLNNRMLSPKNPQRSNSENEEMLSKAANNGELKLSQKLI